MTAPLVSADWLRERLGEPRLRVVDCRYRLSEAGVGERLWLDGHIPGAAFLDLDRDLAAPPGERGRHPLPDPAELARAARRAGIERDTTVVAYDEAGEGGAARLWWLLRHFGHTDVTVLDGGLRGWRASGGPLAGGVEHPPPGTFTANPRSDDTAELAAEATARTVTGPAGGSRLIVDARAPERYRGEVEPIDSVAGRIPGAVNIPFTELVPDGRFLPPEELRARFEAVGARPGDEVVAYCGSGVTACVVVLAAEVAGMRARLYPGSWSEWSGRGLPAEVG